MEKKLYSKIKNLSINEDASITEAFKLMDQIGKKLLLIVDSRKNYKSIISVGDIQRHLIKTQNFKALVSDIIRTKIRVATVNQTDEEIKQEMLLFRTEFMPVVNEKKDLVDVIFWEDLFIEKHTKTKNKIDIPVVIMAGGKGTRLKPITNIIPKPLIPIGDKSIAEHIIDRFVAFGVGKFYFSVNYKAEMIENHFNNLKDEQYKISYFKEDKPLGTAGSLSLLKGVESILDNKVDRIPQKSIHPFGFYCGRRGVGDENINWNQTSRELFNFVRSICFPGPQARASLKNKEIKINKVREFKGVPNYKGFVGQILAKTTKGFLVKTLDTYIEVLSYEYGGKIRTGDRFTL